MERSQSIRAKPGFQLRPGPYVVQIVWRVPGHESEDVVLATAERPREAKRIKRRLERKYPDGPPKQLLARLRG